jgi:hypothetical protein
LPKDSIMLHKLAATFAALALATAAHANTVVFDASGYDSGDIYTEDALVTPLFSSPSSAGLVAFTLTGYGSLDGQNASEDDFTLSVNGVAVLVGTFNLGGGGANALYMSPTGTLVSGYDTDPDSITHNGGVLTFIVPVKLLGAGNDILFSYEALPPPGHTGPQGLDEEGWGLSRITVTALSVPEPGALAMMLAGLGLIGGLARRRTRVNLAAAR